MATQTQVQSQSQTQTIQRKGVTQSRPFDHVYDLTTVTSENGFAKAQQRARVTANRPVREDPELGVVSIFVFSRPDRSLPDD